MPLFEIQNQDLLPVEQTNFSNEKLLQKLVEQNLKPVFNCRFIASEFPTGSQHAGRIDTLALSEEDNPVIVEYKKVESSELINQSLFYLHWIHDHRGDFELAAKKALGNKTEVDWSDVRVICIALNFKKYDLHAVQVMGANIELWQYRLFKNNCLYIEEVFRKAVSADPMSDGGAVKSAVMVAAGKKAAQTRKTGSYTFEQHLANKPELIKNLAVGVQEHVLGLDGAIQEAPKKFYVAYKLSQNIACMELHKKCVLLYLKLDPKTLNTTPSIARDVTSIGHFGTGDLELTLESQADLEAAKPLIYQAYQKIGG
jgi:predicted transport protein